MPEAEQKPVADHHIGVGHVAAVPVLMQPEQAADIASVHCPAAVRLWRQREKVMSITGSQKTVAGECHTVSPM